MWPLLDTKHKTFRDNARNVVLQSIERENLNENFDFDNFPLTVGAVPIITIILVLENKSEK